ncbi:MULTISPECIES: EF-hand domain-containing protein [Streptomyces]|uniref:Calcium-binding protein n=2 Tax=Streptomyces TaxID=1883 RepID=A0A6N9U2V9_STRHA|nr:MULTISPECIES: EF-hand domain-containing protein [Streptomyces]AWL41674.1 calcium-binding protein [Streptomyces sp. SM18]MBV7672203.1 EF-hand domain-containing protein [Streptomyces halstedii]NEA16922.1 calcium-binding protein [Streptomyces halstedii]
MTHAVKGQKFGTLFTWFDQDGDGQLTHDDMRGTAAAFAEVAAWGDEADLAAMRDAFGRWWRLLLTHGDADGDGRVSRQEFITVMEREVTSPEHFEGAVMAIIDALMNALDTDRDGVLSRDEYVRMYDALGIPPQRSGEAFTRLDLDGNGVISREEFRSAVSDFYLSTDPDAPGSHLLGPVGPPA